MGQSFARVWLHIVFSTKERREFLRDDAFREGMFRMMAYHVEQTGRLPVSVGGWHDHIHIICGLTRTLEIADLIEQIKVETSKWAKKASNGVPLFAWQSGYGVFSISHSLLQQVITYVENQATHHARRSYQAEFRLLCKRHGIEIDERYVWD